MNERRIHQIFEISVLLKGAHALIECIGGLVLALVSTNAIKSLVNALTQEELIEDPNDFVELWAYPVSLVVLGLFIVYQLYRFSYTHGVGLIVLTVFDVIVMGLIWHEYRLVRLHLTSR